MTKQKYQTDPKSNRIIVERDNIVYTNTQIHDRSLSWLGTGTSIKSGDVELVLWTQTQNTQNILIRINCNYTLYKNARF